MTAPALSVRVLETYDMVIRSPGDAEAIAELAQLLARSGEQRQVQPLAADIASSGGPSSLSTLLCPLHLVAEGFTVPKIGVPGRPAGGVDTLGTVPGYRTNLPPVEFEQILESAGYVHAIADKTWAPDDSALFQYRQVQGTQAVPSLAIASLLSKKLAAGVGNAALEARIADHGNFGSTIAEAERNAELYCTVALAVGLRPVVMLTDASVPYQPYIGRGEALTALAELLSGRNSDPWLSAHAKLCAQMASIVANHCDQKLGSRNDPDVSDLATIMGKNLVAQGSSFASLEQRVASVSQQRRALIRAESDGFVRYNLSRIRHYLQSANSAVQHQNEGVTSSGFNDEAGIRLLRPPWLEVRRGEAVIEYRSATKHQSGMDGLFTVQHAPAVDSNRVLAVVS